MVKSKNNSSSHLNTSVIKQEPFSVDDSKLIRNSVFSNKIQTNADIEMEQTNQNTFKAKCLAASK